MPSRPKHEYIVMRPNADGTPQGGGYKCGACGLEQLTYGEPHIKADGAVCEPSKDGSPITAFGTGSAPVTRREANKIPTNSVDPSLVAAISQLSIDDQAELARMVGSRLASYTAQKASSNQNTVIIDGKPVEIVSANPVPDDFTTDGPTITPSEEPVGSPQGEVAQTTQLEEPVPF